MKKQNFFKISLIYYLSTIVVCVLFVLGYFGLIKNDAIASVLIQIVTMLAIPMLLYTLLVSKNFKKTLADTGIKKVSLKVVGLCFVLGVALYFLNSFIANFFSSLLSIFGWENLYSKLSTNSVRFSYGLLLKEFVLSAILPAICEEFLHRGILLHAGKKHVDTRYCLIISSILFGLMHLNIQQFFYATILGFIIGYVSLVADSIIPAMILHFTNNALSSYFYYGSILGWGIPSIYNHIINTLASLPLLYILLSCLSVSLILILIVKLIKKLQQIRIKEWAKSMLDNIDFSALPIEEMQAKIDDVNLFLKQKSLFKFEKTQKIGFFNKIFTISTFVLSGLITFSTFIGGLI